MLLSAGGGAAAAAAAGAAVGAEGVSVRAGVGGAGGGGRREALPLRLSHLQSMVRKDPDAYREEVLQQLAHFRSLLALVVASAASAAGAATGAIAGDRATGGRGGGGGGGAGKPGKKGSRSSGGADGVEDRTGSERLEELLGFVSHVAPCYISVQDGASTGSNAGARQVEPMPEMQSLPQELMNILAKNANTLRPPSLRRKICQALMLLHSKGVGADALSEAPGVQVELHKLFLLLFRVQDKQLREQLHDFLVQDVKRVNTGGGSGPGRSARDKQRFNSRLQAHLESVIQRGEEVTAKAAVRLATELYRRQLWTDAGNVNLLGRACLSRSAAVMSMSMLFFLGIEQRIAEDEEEHDEEIMRAATAKGTDKHRPDLVKEVRFAKRTRKRLTRVRRRQLRVAKARRSKDNSEPAPRFPALSMIHDPQSLAEDVFRRARSGNDPFETKLLMLNFVARLVACHKVLMPESYFSFLIKYLDPHQPNATQLLTYTVNSCHDSIPPSYVRAVIDRILFNFVTDRNADEIIAIGLNSVRELFARVPAIFHEDGMDAIVQDLVEYSKSRDKSVTIAARGIINLVRDTHPTLLHRKQRGRDHDRRAVAPQFGELVSESAESVANGTDAAGDSDEDGDSDDDGDDEDVGEQEGVEEDQEAQDEEKDEAGERDDDAEEEVPKLVPIKDAQGTGPGADDQPEKEEQEQEEEDEEEEEESSSEDDSDDVTRAAGMGWTDAISEGDLAAVMVKRKQDKLKRMESILAGREKFQAKGHGGGMTNSEKQRRKNFRMLQKSRGVQAKIKRASADVQRKRGRELKQMLKHEKKKRRRL